jgi:membrane-associated phospholipid phosphatase
MDIKENSKVQLISKLISNFFNPITSLLLYFIYLSYTSYSFTDALSNFTPLFLIIILPIIFWIYYNVKLGKYESMDVSNRKSRKTLYVFINATIIIYILYDFYFNSVYNIMMLFLLILLIILQFSNFFIKSSMHTALNLFVAALFLSQNVTLGILWIFITILVGFSRIILKKHTTKEVLMGFLLSAIVSLAFLYTFNILI